MLRKLPSNVAVNSCHIILYSSNVKTTTTTNARCHKKYTKLHS